MKKIEAVIIMKKLGLSVLLAAICISRSWAGDEPPTIESNKNLIDLVRQVLRWAGSITKPKSADPGELE